MVVVVPKMKAADLQRKLGLFVHPDQILLSHTPLKSIAHKFKSKQVLVLGNHCSLAVAKEYGFKDTISANCVYNKCQSIFPNRQENRPVWNSHYDVNRPISAAMIFHDPTDWALEMQVLSDILSPKIDQQIPFFVCNADIVYNTEHYLPRFTQGAFVESFKHLFQSYHNKPLEITFFGKPFRVQYEFAERMLRTEQRRTNGELREISLDNCMFYGVGDNPLSDICGANSAGPNWRSILVRTGIFQGEGNDDINPADHVVTDVEEAVDLILSTQLRS